MDWVTFGEQNKNELYSHTRCIEEKKTSRKYWIINWLIKVSRPILFRVFHWTAMSHINRLISPPKFSWFIYSFHFICLCPCPFSHTSENYYHQRLNIQSFHTFAIIIFCHLLRVHFIRFIYVGGFSWLILRFPCTYSLLLHCCYWFECIPLNP